MLNMLPKFELEPIRTYLETFCTVPRPAATAWFTTDRSCSSRMMSAAARATSAAPSTEIPTSAACSAGASLMPSPMKPTTWPRRFSASRMRCFCCGLIRQNRLTRGSRPISASSVRWVRTSPVSTPVTGTPISPKTWRATFSLSPVSTLTSTPAAAIARIVAPALAFGGSRKTAKPAKTRSLSSVIVAVSWLPSTARLAMPSARKPSAPSASSVAAKRPLVSASSDRSAPSAARWRCDSRRMSSGAPLTIRRRCPSCSTSTEMRRRSKSNGTSSSFFQPLMSSGRSARIASSSGLFMPLSKRLLMKASAKASGLSPPSPSMVRTSLIWASVKVPVLSVHSTFMAPRSWIAESRLTIT